jgi:hypothetical protein
VADSNNMKYTLYLRKKRNGDEVVIGRSFVWLVWVILNHVRCRWIRLRSTGRYSVYCVAMVTIFDCTPPIVTMTGVVAPVAMPEGTTALT